MKNLIDYGKLAMVIASVPTVMSAQTNHFPEYARNVYGYTKNHGTTAQFQMDDRQIPARYWKLPQTAGRPESEFYVFEVNGTPYLVLRTRKMGSDVEDFIDRASSATGRVDAVLDDVVEQRGTGQKTHHDLKDSLGRADQLYYTVTLMNADFQTRPKIPEPGRLQLPTKK